MKKTSSKSGEKFVMLLLRAETPFVEGVGKGS